MISNLLQRFQSRSEKLEHLDVGDYTVEEYEGCITELQWINRWLGDQRALRRSLLRELIENPTNSFSLLDVGAGSGALLRVTAQWGARNRKKGFYVGVELNPRAAREIRSACNVESVQADAHQLPFLDGAFDYVICSLFTHHFPDDEVVHVLMELRRVAARKLFVIDLHRHPVAYLFYTTVGKLFLHNRLIREDGALSILRSFKPSEMKELASRAGLQFITIKRSFPYRLIMSAEAPASR
ncbi:MAG TPA: methyltransferase domain-containing protein [Pyrinomonadaceae bacterium]|nr:methyltransferase domain-containing protein [Pyrinomonadaceae bacterium]